MELALAGKVVIVTGGGRGIGEAVVRGLAAEGAIPFIVDRDGTAAQGVRGQLVEAGQECEAFVRDLTEPGACWAVIDEVTRVRGGVYGLVNNAGVNDGVSLEQGTPEEFLSSLRLNLVHFFEMAQLTLPLLKKAGGAIVNISSKVALTGQGGTSGYAASKGGILALTREWAVDLLPHGVRVNAVVPAEVSTPLYTEWLQTFPDPQEKLAAIVERIPLGKRMTTPEEVADTVLFLLSSRASHITGQHLVVDGGYTHLDRAIT